MSKITPILMVIIGLTGSVFVSSCSQVWDVTAQQQAKEAVISITVSSRVRNDPNPPQREVAYQTVVTVLGEYIASGNTDSETLKTGLNTALCKVFSEKLANKLTGEIMDMITDMAGSAKDPEKLLAAEKLIYSGIKAGLDYTETLEVK